MPKCQPIRIFISLKPFQPPTFLYRYCCFKCRFGFLKISATYDYILKTDAKVKLKNENYLTQLSLLIEVYAIIHIKYIFNCKIVTAWSTISDYTI